ncbi:MAG TPA: hypothetical protein PKY82_27425 [Pyrinomonadaceae bacterium]|nr:hypothetical protein [Pyrinomonadaceae bacterium]
METRKLGKLESIHGISPVFLQRALIVIILSFIFFLAMLIAFSVRQNIGYFLLATAFLLIKLFTLFSFIQARKKEVKIYENGFSFGKKECLYNEIEKIEKGQLSCQIIKKDGEKITLTQALYDLNSIVDKINAKFSAQGVKQNEKI